MLTANNSYKVIVLIPRKTPKMRCAVKGAYVFRFEYWLDSICNGSNDDNDDNDDDGVVSTIR